VRHAALAAGTGAGSSDPQQQDEAAGVAKLLQAAGFAPTPPTALEEVPGDGATSTAPAAGSATSSGCDGDRLGTIKQRLVIQRQAAAAAEAQAAEAAAAEAAADAAAKRKPYRCVRSAVAVAAAVAVRPSLLRAGTDPPGSLSAPSHVNLSPVASLQGMAEKGGAV
jgi:hypothetical protein